MSAEPLFEEITGTWTNRLRPRHRSEDAGFTLIELMVVVLVIAILLAIAIPTFLGARSRAQDTQAKSSARNALSNAAVIFTDNQSYSGADATGLGTAEPSLTYNAAGTASTGSKNVSVSAASSTWAAAVLSSSGTCFEIKTDSSGNVTYNKHTTPANCTGTDAAATSASSTW